MEQTGEKNALCPMPISASRKFNPLPPAPTYQTLSQIPHMVVLLMCAMCVCVVYAEKRNKTELQTGWKRERERKQRPTAKQFG